MMCLNLVYQISFNVLILVLLDYRIAEFDVLSDAIFTFVIRRSIYDFWMRFKVVSWKPIHWKS